MADAEGVSSDVDFSKMKVADLKKELKSRGLSTVGNKNDLLERLQTGAKVAITDAAADDSELLDEDDVLGDDGLDDESSVDGFPEGSETINEERLSSVKEEKKTITPTKRKLEASKKPDEIRQPKKITLNRNLSTSAHSEKENQEDSVKNTEEKGTEEEEEPAKKIVKISSFSVKDRLELRAQKFGVQLSEAAKKEARANRFGITGSQSSVPVASAEVLKKRAERFGSSVSTLLKDMEQAEKLKLRQERFGIESPASVEEKKKLRAERFKVNNVESTSLK